MKFVFYNENTETKWFFIVNGPCLTEEIESRILKWCKDNELETKYGVHDVSFETPNEIFGFSSYEIEEADFPDLMESWKTFWIMEPNYTVVGSIQKD